MFILTEKEQKELAEALAKACDGVAFGHSTYGWIVSDGKNLIDAFSCEILTSASRPQVVDNRILRVLQEREEEQIWQSL